MEKSVIVDPGELTIEELERQMKNPEEIPFWQMHPLVQHCLRMYQGLYPESTEWKNKDSCGWVKNPIKSCQIFMDKFRLVPGYFNPDFINCQTGFHMWNKYRNT
ncbi:MAG: hypothetical protein PHN69_02630 [Candidatus Pacebacteria bacterium]|nr:hypothetical protein [Candidatus Paceibacterota bacterium]